jgi:putative phosphoesterase
MKLAIVSDVHGNLVALEAVLADLERLRPDIVVNGGDLAFRGPRPAECVDRVRELGWPGVIGNMDRALETHTRQPNVGWATERIGPERNAWLQALPMEWRHENDVALVHAVPGDLWQAVQPETDDGELRAIYGPLGTGVAVYCHIHRPFVRPIGDLTVANTGSVGMPIDGDPRASYLLIEDGRARTRRVAYDIERAAAEVLASDLPGAQAVAHIYRTGRAPG